MQRFGLRLGTPIVASMLLFTSSFVQSCQGSALTVLNPWAHRHKRVAAEPNLMELSKYDVVLIVDKSYSMARVDCPVTAGDSVHKISRWEWCRKEMLDLSKNTAGILPDGIRLVLYSSKVITYDNANAEQIESAFSQNKPDGATKTAQALDGEFSRFFNLKDEELRDGEPEHVRPLLIAVITDGAPNDPKVVIEKIAEASEKMTKPQEIALTFLQVGNDSRAGHFFDQLKLGSGKMERRYDIVTTRPFSELCRVGLQSGLIDAVTPHRSIASAIGTDARN
jgi:hypothetical protein